MTAIPDPPTLFGRQRELGDYLVKGWPALDIPGLPKVSAAAAVGNATQENQCRSVTLGAKDHGSDGLFQWRLDRLSAMQSFANANFGSWQSIEAQAAFFAYECMKDYPSLWSDLHNGTKSLATLTANICDQFERPAAAYAMLDARIKYAADFLNVWTTVVPAPASPPAPSPQPTGTAMNPLFALLVPLIEQVVVPFVAGLVRNTGPVAPGSPAAPLLPDAATIEAIVAEVMKQLQAKPPA